VDISRLGKEVRNVLSVQCSLSTASNGAKELHHWDFTSSSTAYYSSTAGAPWSRSRSEPSNLHFTIRHQHILIYFYWNVLLCTMWRDGGCVSRIKYYFYDHTSRNVTVVLLNA